MGNARMYQALRDYGDRIDTVGIFTFEVDITGTITETGTSISSMLTYINRWSHIKWLLTIMCAIVDKKLSSEIGFRGIFKKVLIFVLVGIGHMIDTNLIGEGSVLRTAIIFFYCSNEGISMLENAGRLGLPIPEKLKDILVQLHNKGGNE